MDHDRIVNKRVQRIARDHGCSVAEVNAALDHHPIELDRDTFLEADSRHGADGARRAAAGLPGKGSCGPGHRGWWTPDQGGGKTRNIAWPESAARSCGTSDSA